MISKAASQPANSKCVLVELPRVVGDTSFDGDAGVIGRVVSSRSAPDACLDLKGTTRLNMPTAIMLQQNCIHSTRRCVSLYIMSVNAASACMHACAGTQVSAYRLSQHREGRCAYAGVMYAMKHVPAATTLLMLYVKTTGMLCCSCTWTCLLSPSHQCLWSVP